MHPASGDNASSRNNGIQRHAFSSSFEFISEDKFGRRILALIGADRPGLVVEIEEGVDGDEIHVGLKVGVQCADVTPVFHLFPIFILKVVGEDLSIFNHARDDIFAEIVGGFLRGILE